MNAEDAIMQACSSVGIWPPKSRIYGKWLYADTLDGKSGKGDGRVILDENRVTAHNWRTGESVTVWLRDNVPPKERRRIAFEVQQEKDRQKQRAARAAKLAAQIVEDATPSRHPYLAGKGFPDELALVISAEYLLGRANKYLVAGDRAIVMPARKGAKITSVQLIWEDGTKKFLAGGAISGSCHRIATGRDVWLCEGLATGLSLRAALKAIGRADTALCCFSASNLAEVARQVSGRCYIIADNDKPMEQFDGLGTGEHWARVAGKPYALPPERGDINDMHMRDGIYAVQAMITRLIREARM